MQTAIETWKYHELKWHLHKYFQYVTCIYLYYLHVSKYEFNEQFYFVICGFLGIFTRNLRGAMLIVPRKVNHLGEHLSHNLTQHHSHNYYYDDDLTNSTDHLVHYQIQINNDTMHLEME